MHSDELAVPKSIPSRKKIGVLLVNLGTPEDTDYWSVRRYLKEFLSDRRVVETSPLVWWPILNLAILSIRPQRSGKSYRKVWNTGRNESPLKTITRAQADALTAWVDGGGLAEESGSGPAISVAWAMRYGLPSIAQEIARLTDEGCDRLLVVPLYPQYSATTTATAGDAVFAALERQRFQPALRIAPPYYDDPVYIEALAASLHKALAGLTFTPDVILVSFHGIPKAYADKGDLYPLHCEETFSLLAKALGRAPGTLRMSYQSRFGATEWLQPYTDKTVIALAREGVKNLAVMTPGFSADCLETLQEINIENRHFFCENGGENFALIPCLNASAEGMKLIFHLVARELSGWLRG